MSFCVWVKHKQPRPSSLSFEALGFGELCQVFKCQGNQVQVSDMPSMLGNILCVCVCVYVYVREGDVGVWISRQAKVRVCDCVNLFEGPGMFSDV